MDKQEILRAKLARADRITERIVGDNLPQRAIYSDLERRLLGFMRAPRPNPCWIIMPGLRGVGKTTLLAQLYRHPKLDNQAHKFYLSLDDPQIGNFSYEDLVAAFEHSLGVSIYDSDEKIFLFLDEVHFWPEGKWSINLKILYDRCPRLFMICTGSSALHLNLGPDSARRADIIQVPPLNLPEFLLIEAQASAQRLAPMIDQSQPRQMSIDLKRHLDNDLNLAIKQALFGSETAETVSQQLKLLEPQIRDFWSVANRSNPNQSAGLSTGDLVKRYIEGYGTLPHIVGLQQGFVPAARNQAAQPGVSQLETDQALALAHDAKTRIENTLRLVVERDLDVLSDLSAKTRGAVFDLLLILAHSDNISLAKIARSLANKGRTPLSITTLRELLKALTQTEVLIEVQPLGGSRGRATKPAKYLFATPALRLALSPLSLRSASQSSPDQAVHSQLRGRLLEDTVAMYLQRLFIGQPLGGVLEYDAKGGGADFIMTTVGAKLISRIIEVGWHKNSHQQITQTRRRLKSSGYGLVITDSVFESRLEVDDEVVYIPLSTFLLL